MGGALCGSNYCRAGKLFGAPGLIIGYLIWEKRTVGAERMQLDREHIETDKQFTASLAALTTTIRQGQR